MKSRARFINELFQISEGDELIDKIYGLESHVRVKKVSASTDPSSYDRPMLRVNLKWQFETMGRVKSFLSYAKIPHYSIDIKGIDYKDKVAIFKGERPKNVAYYVYTNGLTIEFRSVENENR